jgi:hypothetical protein
LTLPLNKELRTNVALLVGSGLVGADLGRVVAVAPGALGRSPRALQHNLDLVRQTLGGSVQARARRAPRARAAPRAAAAAPGAGRAPRLPAAGRASFRRIALELDAKTMARVLGCGLLHCILPAEEDRGRARGQDVVALPPLLVADHQSLQLRVAAVRAAGRDVELPSRPAAPAAAERAAAGGERPAGAAALQGPPPPNARALCARPWHRLALLMPSREPVPLAFVVSASRGLWKKCA